MKDKKKWVIGLLCTLVCIMAVGYAVLAQQLNINGTASIDSTWKVEITNIQEQEVVGKATSKVTPSYTSTTANFSVGLTQPGDSITYDVEISNLGTLDAKVDSININVDENDAIKYTTTGIANGDKLAAGAKTTLTIKVEYDSSITSQPSVTTSDITVTINYVQDLGEESTETGYDYVIGDTITFAGSNWYVIKNSTSDEDYVTLLKETALTNEELGEYSYDDTNKTMEYTWTDTCHNANHGYAESNHDDCNNTNSYETSKVKEFLEGTYINTLGSDNLKEVDNYKIRLITLEELKNNLEWNNASYEADWQYVTGEGNNVFTWVYNTSYWTMTPHPDDSIDVIFVAKISDSNAALYHQDANGNNNGLPIRPVINLLKTSI